MKKHKANKRRQVPRRKPTKASKAHRALPPIDLEAEVPREAFPAGMAWVEATIGSAENLEGLECLAPEAEAKAAFEALAERLRPWLKG